MRRMALAGFILFGTVFTPLLASAQDCEIDLTDSIIALTQAQADAANGDNASALSAITDVQAQLETTRQNCLNANVSLSNLTETFTEPDFFSVQYPEGWFAGEFHEGMDWERAFMTVNPNDVPLPLGGTVTVTSEEVTSDYSPYVALEGVQSVTVSVGNPLHLFAELGVYSEDFAEAFLGGTLDFAAVADALEARLSTAPTVSNLVVTPIEAARPTITFEASDETTNIALVLVALDETENRYALLVSVTLLSDNTSMLPLLLQMAETVS